MPDQHESLYSNVPFLRGGGQMGELIRSIDWANNALGKPDSWPDALKHAVSMLLKNKFPVLVCWGPDYIQLYNDAFRPINGETKHPRAMGGSAKDTYAEIWETIGPMFSEVMAGQTHGFSDFMVRLDRNGLPEDCYFDFSYSPISTINGEIEGILVICVETTERVKAEQQTIKAQAAISNERDRLARFFMQAPAGICILDGPDLIFQLINPLYQQLFPGRDLLKKPLLEAVPEVKDAAIWDILQHVYTTGETFEGKELLIPLARTSTGPVEDRYFNFIYQARKNNEGGIDGILVFVIEVTNMVKIQQDQLALNEELLSANEALSLLNDDLSAAREQLEASETRFRFMLNAIPQQVWTAQADGALNYVNQVVCDDFGYSTEEIVGQGWQAFIHSDDLANCLEKWTRALAAGTEYTAEFRLKFKDGNYYWHLARAVPFAEGNQVKLWLGTNTNIHVQKTNEQRKDEFLSIASHELKTPLTSIKAYNQILQRITDPEKLKPFLKKSSDHITRLERLISDLLDVTKINAGKVNYVMEPFNVKMLLADSIESLQQSVTSHQIILQSAPDISYTGDQLRLEQVIHNFLSNAIKYSPEAKQVLVNSHIDQHNVIVSVQDFGIGIARENIDRLFDRYYRVDNTAMRFEGLGLGLFISAEILRKHGGSFWIESEQGKGSTFFFRLPLHSKEKSKVARTATFYRDQHLTINYNQTKKRLEVDWTGFQDMSSVQHGCILMWEYLKQNQCDRVVNDNTNVMGNWSEATDWVGNIWFPMMEKAGLKYFAHVFSPSIFSQLAAMKSIDIMAGIVTTQYFTDVDLAGQWIDQQ